jgi:hypothetical protein
MANPDIGMTQIAHHLGVSPATLYIPAARTANILKNDALQPARGYGSPVYRFRWSE